MSKLKVGQKLADNIVALPQNVGLAPGRNATRRCLGGKPPLPEPPYFQAYGRLLDFA